MMFCFQIVSMCVFHALHWVCWYLGCLFCTFITSSVHSPVSYLPWYNHGMEGFLQDRWTKSRWSKQKEPLSIEIGWWRSYPPPHNYISYLWRINLFLIFRFWSNSLNDSSMLNSFYGLEIEKYSSLVFPC